MTLKMWCDITGKTAHYATIEGSAAHVYSDRTDANHWDLWSLKDYKVSTVSGPVIWLVPVN